MEPHFLLMNGSGLVNLSPIRPWLKLNINKLQIIVGKLKVHLDFGLGKPVFGFCAQSRHRPACAQTSLRAQFDQRLIFIILLLESNLRAKFQYSS